jgi:hypothetical protein
VLAREDVEAHLRALHTVVYLRHARTVTSKQAAAIMQQ